VILSPEQVRELSRLERLAEWLDAKYEMPFGIRVGWDGILGLLPVVGECVTTLISGYLIARAAMLGASTPVLLRLGWNVAVDDGISLLPFVGWLGDFAWKSNLKNTRLLRAHLTDPRTARRRSIGVLASVIAVVFMASLTFALLVGIVAWLVGVFIYRGVLY
jgi:hypothetical protein